MPRKVTDKIVSAFLAGRTAKQANTSTDGNSLFLHGNEIAKMKNGQLWISNAGWFSSTTKERLNGLPGVRVAQKAGKWYLNGVEWDGKWISVGKPSTSESRRVAEARVKKILRKLVMEEVVRAVRKKKQISESRLRENSNSGFIITYYATVGQHGDTGKQYSTYQSAMRDAITKSMDEDFMDGLEYLGVEPFGDETKFAILYIEDRYINNVADYIQGEKNKQIWKSVAKRVLDGQNKAGGKGVVPQNGNFVNESKKMSIKNRISEGQVAHDSLKQYVETALWSTTDGDSGNLDDEYGFDDLAPQTLKVARQDLGDFFKKAKPYLSGLDLTDVAHDFWLTRNHHGAGFWDGDYEDGIGEELDKIAQTFKEQEWYSGDDGKIYILGKEK